MDRDVTTSGAAIPRVQETPSTSPFQRPVFYRLVSVASVAAVFVAWFVLTKEIIRPLFFPSPKMVWDALIDLRGILAAHAGVTLYRVVVSFVIGALAGSAVGMIMSRYRTIHAILDPIIETLRPVPPLALIPFFILWFGIGDFGKLLLSAIGVFMVMVVNTLVAIRNVPPIYLRAAASLGASRAHIYRTVLVPAIIPTLVAGWRVGAALAFALTIAAELMGAQAGIGYLIMVARRSLHTDTILLGIIVLSLLAWFVDQAIRLAALKLTHWMEHAPD